MFTCDLYAGVIPQMSPPPHDLERLRTTMVDFIVIGDAASCRGLCTGRVFNLAQRPVEGHPPSTYYYCQVALPLDPYPGFLH